MSTENAAEQRCPADIRHGRSKDGPPQEQPLLPRITENGAHHGNSQM